MYSVATLPMEMLVRRDGVHRTGNHAQPLGMTWDRDKCGEQSPQQKAGTRYTTWTLVAHDGRHKRSTYLYVDEATPFRGSGCVVLPNFLRGWVSGRPTQAGRAVCPPRIARGLGRVFIWALVHTGRYCIYTSIPRLPPNRALWETPCGSAAVPSPIAPQPFAGGMTPSLTSGCFHGTTNDLTSTYFHSRNR